ncbi:TniQ family protein [Paenibacillus contaminans]|uniref:TniQ domain-containing protein n=1 Tax=Paenibacillus contaminans TaxID=450362 RepID=A0A329MGY8_9BACL|nr:TniQ family protein [Paenibacillus contaminans]RAV19104.1 hypothetical protein DQG23_21420 [Paenibacillus contaminans]
MYDEKRYAVRPKIEEGEALTSYLFRLAEANGTSFLGIIHTINTQDYLKIYSKRYYHLDLIPYRQVDVSLLESLLCMSYDELLSHTYYPAVAKIYDNPLDEIDDISFRLSLLIETKKRKFCRKCLLGNRGYKLIWQIKDIEICKIHNIPIESVCRNCGKIQPFTREQMMIPSCVFCTYTLSFGHEDCVVKEVQQEFSIQLKIYEVWERLLRSKGAISSRIDDFNLQQTLALKMLYLSQSQESKYRMSRIKYLTKREIKFLRRLIRGEDSKYHSIIGILIHFFLKSNYSIEEFQKVDVSQEFIQSMLGDQQKTERGPCFTPWCQYKGTTTNMFEYTHYKKANVTHHTSSICTSCFVSYGYDRKTGEWGEIGNTINLVSNIILPLLEAGISRKKMGQMLADISINKINNIIGYMYNQNLIQKDYKFLSNLKLQIEEGLVNKFKILRKHVGGFRYKMLPIANKLFGWSTLEFYIYYYSSEVQMYLIHNERKKEKEPRVHKDLDQKLVEYQEICMQKKRTFSSKDFNESYGVSRGVLGYYNLFDEVAAAREKQKEQLKSEEIQLYWSKAREYTEKMLNEEQPFNCKSVYTLIGRRRKWLKENCPDLARWIHQQVEVSKRQQVEIQLHEAKRKIKETIKQLVENDINLSKTNIAKYSGINVWGQIELGMYYHSLIESLGEGENSDAG